MSNELDILLKINILSVERVSEIIKQRLKFDALLFNNPTIDNFKNFINAETSILKEISNAKCNEYESHKMKAAGFMIAKNIFSIYKQAIFHFEQDVKLWISCVTFCNDTGLRDMCGTIMDRMLKVHKTEVLLWRTVADIYADRPETGRQYYLRGIHHFNDDKELHRGLFELEIVDADRTGNRDYTQAKLVYLNSLKYITDVDFFTSLITVAQQFDFTVELQKRMLVDLMKMHPTEESVWDFVAQREKNGFHYDKIEDYTEDPNVRRVNRCIEVYKKAIIQINTQKMWEYYMDALIIIEPSLEFFEHVFKEANELGFLTEYYYIKWQQFVAKNGTEDCAEFELLLKLGTERCPTSVDLWKSRIQFYIARDNHGMIQHIFNEGVKHTGLDSYPLWRVKLLYHLVSLPVTVEINLKNTKHIMLQSQLTNFYDEACKQQEPISGPFKLLYLDWVNMNKGIAETRKVYSVISTYEPHSFDLHMKMADFETVQFKLYKLNEEKSLTSTDDCAQHLRAVYKYAVQQFGSKGTDAWIAYIKFEMNWGCPKIVKDIYAYAQTMLPPDLMKMLETEYSHFLNGLPV